MPFSENEQTLTVSGPATVEIVKKVQVCNGKNIFKLRRGGDRRHRPFGSATVFLSVCLSVCAYLCFFLFPCLYLCLSPCLYSCMSPSLFYFRPLCQSPFLSLCLFSYCYPCLFFASVLMFLTVLVS